MFLFDLAFFNIVFVNQIALFRVGRSRVEMNLTDTLFDLKTEVSTHSNHKMSTTTTPSTYKRL